MGVPAVSDTSPRVSTTHGRTGPLVLARNELRAARRAVVKRGWQQSRLFGGLVRWLGKRLP